MKFSVPLAGLNRRSRSVFAWAALAWCLSAATQVRAGSIIDLGTLGGDFSEATAISANGKVTGTATLANGIEHAFLYTGGSMQDLGAVGTGHAVNSAGAVVGQFRDPATGNYTAFEYYNGTLAAMTLDPAQATGLIRYNSAPDLSNATAINEKGEVAGSVTVNGFPPFLFYYAAGHMSYLEYPGEVYAGGLNNNGQIAGYYNQSGVDSPLSPSLPPGTLGGGSIAPLALNDSGQIVGTSTTNSSQTHAFLYSGGRLTDLDPQGNLPSAAAAISADGHIVGWTEVPSAARYRAVLYSGGIVTDLNTFLPANSGWTLTDASGVNDAGQIVGTGLIGGQEHAYLLQLSASEFSPSSSPSSAPEPATWVLLLAGIPAFAFRRKNFRGAMAGFAERFRMSK